MSKVIKEPVNIIVLEGIPYSLVRHDPIDYCTPCAPCDLSDLCLGDDGGMRLVNLCTPDGLDESYFFQEDWDAVENKIINYTHIDKCQVELDK